MMNAAKYRRQYFLPPERCMEWTKKEYIDHPPIWCSVDLRLSLIHISEPTRP